MADLTNALIATAAMKPGEQTTEYKQTVITGTWGTVMMVCGMIVGVLPPVIDAIRAVPNVEGSQTGKMLLTIAGVVIAVAGAVMKAIATGSYNTSRGILKASALRDMDVSSPTPPPAA